MEGAIIEAVQAEGGTVYRVRVIRAGLSLNRRHYPAEVLRTAVPLFEGARVFAKSDTEHSAGAGKDVRNLLGRLSAPRWIDADGCIEATMTLIAGADDPVAIRIREATARGIADLFGLSIDATGDVRRDARGVLHVSRLREVKSVDLIVEPGAGGQILSVVEAAPEEHRMDRDQLIALIRGANPALLDGVDVETVTVEELQAVLARALAPEQETVSEAEPETGAPSPPPTREEALAAIRALDASLIPADLSAVTDEELRAILDRARAAAAAAMVTSVTEAAVSRALRARARIDACGLPPASRARLLGELEAGRLTEAALTRRIQDEGAYLTSLGVTPAAPSLGRGRARVTEAQETKHGAMLDAFFDPEHEDHRHARSLRECYIAITGDTRVTGQIRNAKRLTEALTSASFTDVLGDSMTRRMVAEYRGATDLDMWRLLTGVPVPVGDFRTQERTRFGGYGDLPAVNEAAAYVAMSSPTDEAAEYSVTKRGGLETITLEMIKNDDVGAVQRIPRKLARAAKRTLCKFVLDFIRQNPAIYDTKTLFHVDHGNLGTTALSANSYAAARLAMVTQTEYRSTEAIGIGPRNLWVPSALEETAWNLFRRGTNLDTTFVQSLTPNIVPVWYWTDANDWACSADPADIPIVEIGFLDGEEEPALFVQDNPSVGSLFTNDQVTYKIRHIYGAAVLDWRGVYKAVVT